MKRSNEFLLRDVAGKLVLVPVGQAARRFPGMVSVNATGKFLWEQLETEQTLETLTHAVTQRYAVEPEQAQTDVRAFLERLMAVEAVVE